MKKWKVIEAGIEEEFEVGEDYLSGVNNIDKIKELMLFDDYHKTTLRVTYKNGDILVYQDVYGSWGAPVRFRDR